MAYKLAFDDLTAAVRACAHDQLRDAVDQLEHRRAEDPVRAVHEARKDLKKTRALVRLVRPALKARTYRAENGALRDAAGRVSGARDADVMVAVADELAPLMVGRISEQAADALRARLEGARGTTPPSEIEAAVAELRAADERVDAWVPEALTRDVLIAGMLRAYAEGRGHFRHARDHDPTPEELHEWRKRVKDLWYHTRLVEPAWPALLGPQAAELKVLSEHLGDDHDLAVFAGHVGDDPELEPLHAIVADRRAELLAWARGLGERVYAERPKAFAARMDHLIAAAEREARATVPAS
ncbi:MAG: CHAD domain-containing protein [Solirubrobacterales bacterium]|nr:CHAD domain-containing protein [Solirubrobacterales bacterium]